MSNNSSTQIPSPLPAPALGYWLMGCASLVFVMVLVGAITRLTESGLSMVEWRPLIGALPPMSETEWQRVFDLYKQTPEFQAEVNAILLECRDNAKQRLRNLLTNSLVFLEEEMNNPESRHKVNIALKMFQLVRINELVHEDIGPVNPDIVQKIKEDKDFKDLFLSG